MADAPPPRYREPKDAPSPFLIANLRAWQAMTTSTTARTEATAKVWRNGLAGFVTLVLSALVLKGPDISSIATPYKWFVIGLFVLGICAAVFGLWCALRAEAPQQALLEFGKLMDEHGSMAEYDQDLASSSTTMLNRARTGVVVALVALILGATVWWSSPPASSDTQKLLITTAGDVGNRQLCGESVEAPDGHVLIKVNDATPPVAVALANIRSLELVPTC